MNQPALTRAEARARAALISDVAYGVHLDVAGDDTAAFTSRCTITFDAAEVGASTFLDLVAVDVVEVVVNGTPAPDAWRNGRIHLTDLQERNEVVVEARCPYSRAGVGLHRFVDPVDAETFLYTQFEPQDAHRVFACFDQPDLKARITVSAAAPAGWEVVSNSAVATRPPEGSAGLWTFEPTPPISTYLCAVVAGNYHKVTGRHGDVDLGVYCRRSMATHLDPEEVLEITRQGLDYFADAFGMAYPFGKYDQLFVPEFNFGAMENPGCVTFSERYIFRSRVTQAARMSRANTILHEMAHMWFGDLVTMRWWDDLWLNESFATFMAHTAVAEATRFGNDSWADFAQSMKAWAYMQDQLPSTHPIVADVPDTHSVMANFDGITYAKGASVLKQLAAWVGMDAFLAGLQDYFPTHAYDNADLADFLGALEKPSGRDLGPWSRTWLQTAGVNTLGARVQEGEDGTMRSVTVTQRAPDGHPTLRPHRLAIGLYDTLDGQLTRVDRVEVDIDGPETEVAALHGRFRPELLLINDEDLAYAKVRLDERSVATLERALGTMADNVARAVCWGSLWDAARDGELAARRFADLVCEHGAVEGDVGMLQTLLQQALSSANRYGAPENRPAVMQRIAKACRAALDRAEPGSDRQLLWMRALVATRTDAPWARGVLSGSIEVPSLAVDTDLRWYVLQHLAAMGEADEADLRAELERDPSDLGQRNADSARAAFPEAEAKAAAWERALDSSLAMHTRRAVLSGFWQVGQESLLEVYAAERWVEALPGLWVDASSEEGLTMTQAMYPNDVVDEAVVAAADRALEDDVPGLAKRAVAEGRDGTLRALKARAADA